MSRMKRKKIISIICYILIFAFLLVPMIAFDNKKYSLLRFGIQVATDNRGYEVRVIIQSVLLISLCVISILYLLSCIVNRCFDKTMIIVFIISIIVIIVVNKIRSKAK